MCTSKFTETQIITILKQHDVDCRGGLDRRMDIEEEAKVARPCPSTRSWWRRCPANKGGGRRR